MVYMFQIYHIIEFWQFISLITFGHFICHIFSSSESGARMLSDPGTLLGLKVASKHFLKKYLALFEGGDRSNWVLSTTSPLLSTSCSRSLTSGGGSPQIMGCLMTYLRSSVSRKEVFGVFDWLPPIEFSVDDLLITALLGVDLLETVSFLVEFPDLFLVLFCWKKEVKKL